jgi:SAM-dependent methyltransferase
MTDVFPTAETAVLQPHPEFGFLRVSPMPDALAISRFYEERYFGLLAREGRAPDIAKLVSEETAANAERRWLETTIWADAEAAFSSSVAGRVLDVGCGSGDLVAHLLKKGFRAEGLDPSTELVAHGRAQGLEIHAGDIISFASDPARQGAYDGISLIGVIECLPDAVGALRILAGLLRPGGTLFIRAGNQFNPLQVAAQETLDLKRWWVVLPDHLNYFDGPTLQRTLRGTGFDVVDAYSDFPMEMFLLMGDDYVSDRSRGAAAHAKRMRFEMSLTPEVRRSVYRGFAAGGVGRCVFAVARKS